jgi:hypothetical protein
MLYNIFKHSDMKYKIAQRIGILKVALDLLTMFLIWMPFPIILIMDLFMEIYHRTCFPIYNLEIVKRSDYIQVMDRNKLQYLTWYEKIGCMYCGYVNGVFRYVKEISGRTESYWCGVMHEGKKGFIPQETQIRQDFVEFGNEKDFIKKYKKP